jgi:hypothetical protein
MVVVVRHNHAVTSDLDSGLASTSSDDGPWRAEPEAATTDCHAEPDCVR